MSSEPNNSKWRLLNTLKTVVKKVTFLINSDVNRWRLISAFTGGGGASRRRLSFGERLGLTAIVSSSDDEDESCNFEVCDSGSSSSSSGKLQKAKSFRVQRTTSFREEDDVDKRAEMFIENFYRRLRYEKEVSLQLRYKRDTSFGSSSDSTSP